VKLDKQDPRAQALARNIADLIREYERETDNRVEGLAIGQSAPGLYDVQLQIRFIARSLDTFTHSTRAAVADEREGEK
jgi:hypothetical protein